MITWIGFATILTALALVYVGLRGRTVGFGRACRRCGYDLRGTPMVKRCPECGADLTLRRSIRIEFRERRLVLVAVGVFLLLIGGAAASPSVQRSTRSMLSIHNRPQWWLRQSLLSIELASSDPAAVELRQRILDGKLKPTDGPRLLAALRERQLLGSLSWTGPLRALVETALQNRIFPNDKALEQFLAESIKLECFEPVRVASAVSWPHLRVSEVRSVSRHLLILEMDKIDIEFIDHPTLNFKGCSPTDIIGIRLADGTFLRDPSYITFMEPLPPSYFAILGEGSHPIRLRLRYRVKLDSTKALSQGIALDVPATYMVLDFVSKVNVPVHVADPQTGSDRP
jgi:hypothetical protein